MAAAGVAISNNSGLIHIAAAIGTPTMGIFGPTSPYLWAPLNGLAATVQTSTPPSCELCQRTVCTMNDHACMRTITASEVVAIAERILADTGRALRINVATAIDLAPDRRGQYHSRVFHNRRCPPNQ